MITRADPLSSVRVDPEAGGSFQKLPNIIHFYPLVSHRICDETKTGSRPAHGPN